MTTKLTEGLSEKILEKDAADDLVEVLNSFDKWIPWKTRTSKRQVASISFINNIPAIINGEPFDTDSQMAPIIFELMFLAIQTIKDPKDTPVFLELFINWYRDGSDSCPGHSHGCRQITLSLGSERPFTINSKTIIIKHGYALYLNGQNHSVPKTKDTEPRYSFNLFYTTSKENKTNIYS